MDEHRIETLKAWALQILEKGLNIPDVQFRDGQWEAIRELVVDRGRILLVQRTGWGKSYVYFTATRLLRDTGLGPSILISPLLALMRNQIEAAERMGVRAASINSTNRAEWEVVGELLRKDRVDLLLISPERLANEQFRDQVLTRFLKSIGMFIVDEAHCVSDWGHDFRPDYMRIAGLINSLPPNVPILATTATANNRVIKDIEYQFGNKFTVRRGVLSRDGLKLQCLNLKSQAERLAWIASAIPKFAGSGIIYVLTIKDAERVAGFLCSTGIDARAYHAKIEEGREELEQMLLNNEIKVLVATTALGMGFDKPDLSFVIHFQRPQSVVHYYQQVGRAGRRLLESYGILLGGDEDLEINEYFFNSAFPTNEQVVSVMGIIEKNDGVRLSNIESQCNLRRSVIQKVLDLLSVQNPSPISRDKSIYYRNPVPWKYNADRANQIISTRYMERDKVLEYFESDKCLMKFLRDELNDPGSIECGICSNCTGEAIFKVDVPENLILDALNFLKQNYINITPRKKWPTGGFAHYKWSGSIKESQKCCDGKALCIWGDTGWGKLVREGKFHDHYSDKLVDAVAKMVEKHFLRIAPSLITFIPSIRHPMLVPDFASRLAKKLNIPCRDVLTKTRETEEQKSMNNSAQQSANLDGVFAYKIDSRLTGVVLLVDDMVDSRWTMTIVGAILRENGADVVIPVALSVSTSG